MSKKIRKGPLSIQVGKKGFTEDTLSSIKSLLSKHNELRVVFLSNSPASRENLEEYKLQLSKLYPRHSVSSIGFTITLKKAVRQTKKS